MNPAIKIDISENILRNRGRVLDILLIDRTRHKPSRPSNIIWATESYQVNGKDYASAKQIKREQVTGLYGKLIQPRAAKSLVEQKYRTKDKAEVFTPLKIVAEMNAAVDHASKNYPYTKDNWLDYVSELRLEITCGEAPFIAGRYNPTSNTGIIIQPHNRVGFLDKKLQAVHRHTKSKSDWLVYAEAALKSCYGYEWQGDNLLIARENILLTVNDFYRDKFKGKSGLSTERLEHFANIISWNIFQMDGIKYVAPMSCHHETRVIPGELTLFGETPDLVEKDECEGCKFGRPTKHNGKYVKIMDWENGRPIKFIELLESK